MNINKIPQYSNYIQGKAMEIGSGVKTSMKGEQQLWLIVQPLK